MTIDLHILVSIVQLFLIAIGGIGTVWTLKSKLDLLIQETSIKHIANVERFKDIEDKLDTLSHTAVEIVKQEARMNSIDIRLQELSNRLVSGFKRRPTSRA
jgi:hypothetical protein